MSIWTNVYGVVVLDTFANTTHQAVYMAKCILDHLPKIKGSEGPIDIFINQPTQPNIFTSDDELWAKSNLLEDYSFDINSIVVLTLYGNLRDIYAKETLVDITKWLNRLSSRVHVSSVHLTINDYTNQYYIDNPKWVVDKKQNDWWQDYQSGYLKEVNAHYGNKKEAKNYLKQKFTEYINSKEE